MPFVFGWVTGGTPSASVSGKTDVLVYGQDAGSNYRKAQERGIECWDEFKWKQVLREAGVSVQ